MLQIIKIKYELYYRLLIKTNNYNKGALSRLKVFWIGRVKYIGKGCVCYLMWTIGVRIFDVFFGEKIADSRLACIKLKLLKLNIKRKFG
jgi:hypothetical protein